MQKIDRNALSQSKVAGGCCKCSCNTKPAPAPTPKCGGGTSSGGHL